MLDGGRKAGAQIAFTNQGGVRADLIPAADGSVTFGQIFAVQPFGNDLVVMTLTGAQLKALLEQQFDSGKQHARQADDASAQHGLHSTPTMLDAAAGSGSSRCGSTASRSTRRRRYRVAIGQLPGHRRRQFYRSSSDGQNRSTSASISTRLRPI